MTAWDVRVSPHTVGRGESLTVDVGNVERFRAVRVELLLVERKLKANFNIRQNHSRVAETVTVAPGETSVEVIVPGWVPDTYSGETIGWDYEVRVVGDDLGPDTYRTEPIVIDGGAPVVTEADGFIDARTGGPIRRLPALGRNPDPGPGPWLIIAIVAAMGAAIATIGATAPHVFPLVFGLVIMAFAVVLGIDTLLEKPLPIDHLDVEVPDGVVRPGEAVEIQVHSPTDSPIDPAIEVGIEAVEIYTSTSSNRRVSTWRPVIERFQPMTRSTVRVRAHPDDPGGYAGEEVSLHWTVSLRMIGTAPRRRRSRTRRIPISRLD